MILVIAEKPSVAQTIAAVLGAKEKKDGFLTGSGYIVSWCVGHLVGLSEAAAYGEQYKKWSYDSLPILPQEWKYTVSADKEKQFKTLKELMHRADVSEVVNACDAGREGELIFRFVYEMAGCKKPMEDELMDVEERVNRQQIAEEMMSVLSDKQKKVVQEFYWNQKTHKQIAKENGVKRNAVTEILKYALNKIEKNYDEDGKKR